MTLLCRFQRAIPSFSALEPLIFALCSPLFASNQVDRTVSVVHKSWQLLVLRRSWGELKVGELKVGGGFHRLPNVNCLQKVTRPYYPSEALFPFRHRIGLLTVDQRECECERRLQEGF